MRVRFDGAAALLQERNTAVPFHAKVAKSLRNTTFLALLRFYADKYQVCALDLCNVSHKRMIPHTAQLRQLAHVPPFDPKQGDK